MTKRLEAIVRGNKLVPIEALGLPENERVWVTVESLNQNGIEQEETLFDAFKRHGAIGMVKGLPPDLSTNPKHMEGFGE